MSRVCGSKARHFPSFRTQSNQTGFNGEPTSRGAYETHLLDEEESLHQAVVLHLVHTLNTRGCRRGCTVVLARLGTLHGGQVYLVRRRHSGR